MKKTDLIKLLEKVPDNYDIFIAGNIEGEEDYGYYEVGEMEVDSGWDKISVLYLGELVSG